MVDYFVAVLLTERLILVFTNKHKFKKMVDTFLNIQGGERKQREKFTMLAPSLNGPFLQKLSEVVPVNHFVVNMGPKKSMNILFQVFYERHFITGVMMDCECLRIRCISEFFVNC